MIHHDALIAHFDVQDAILAQYASKLAFNDSPCPKALECTVPYEHDCVVNETTLFGTRITLWARLELPEARARKHSTHVKMFRAIKVNAPRGMANGPSPLRREVKVDEKEDSILRRSDSDEW